LEKFNFNIYRYRCKRHYYNSGCFKVWISWRIIWWRRRRTSWNKSNSSNKRSWRQ